MTIEDAIAEGLLDWGEILVKNMQEAIDKQVLHSGGQQSKMIGSNPFNVVKNKGEVTFKFKMADYYKFFDEGVDGTEKTYGSRFKFIKGGGRIPKDAMLKFIDIKGINVKYKKSKDKAVKQQSVKKAKESLAFAMGASIKKKGIKPHPFYQDAKDKSLVSLKDILGPIIKKQFITEIKDGSNNK